MRGFFGIGVEGINKAFNVGSVFRSAHAFGAKRVARGAATRLPRARACSPHAIGAELRAGPCKSVVLVLVSLTD